MIANVTSTTAAAGTAAASRASGPPSPEAVFNKLDSGGKGYLTADDLQSAIVAISPQGAQLSSQDAAAAAQAEVARMDSDQDGQVSQQEFVQAGPPDPPPGGAGAPAGAAAGGAPARGARPAGSGDGDGDGPHGGGGGGGGGGSGAAAASSSTTYEPADANRDGKVTQPEQQAYDQKHPQSSDAAKTYAAVAQAG